MPRLLLGIVGETFNKGPQIYIYIYTYIHTYIHKYTYIYTHTYMRTLHTRDVCVYIYICMYVGIQFYVGASTRTAYVEQDSTWFTFG